MGVRFCNPPFKSSVFVLIFLLFFCFNFSIIATEKKEIVFGVVPYLSTQKLFAQFGPLADYISDEIGIPVRLETARDFATFLRRTNEEKRYDLIFTAPHFYYMAQRQAGYKVVVRLAARELRATIVVLEESDIKNLQDLKGKNLSIVDPLGLISLMVRAHLSKAGLIPDKDLTLVNTPNHAASFSSAVKGITDAAGLTYSIYNSLKLGVLDELRVIATTDGVPHMPVAVAQRLNNSIVNKITKALLQLRTEPKYRELLQQMRLPGFVAIKPEAYDKLEWAVNEIK